MKTSQKCLEEKRYAKSSCCNSMMHSITSTRVSKSTRKMRIFRKILEIAIDWSCSTRECSPTFKQIALLMLFSKSTRSLSTSLKTLQCTFIRFSPLLWKVPKSKPDNSWCSTKTSKKSRKISIICRESVSSTMETLKRRRHYSDKAWLSILITRNAEKHLRKHKKLKNSRKKVIKLLKRVTSMNPSRSTMKHCLLIPITRNSTQWYFLIEPSHMWRRKNTKKPWKMWICRLS